MHISSIRTSFLVTSFVMMGISIRVLPGNAPSVKLIQSVDLPGYSGDFDHFAVDFDRGRLLLAAEDHGTLEVFDLKTSAHLRSIVTGSATPTASLSARDLPPSWSPTAKSRARLFATPTPTTRRNLWCLLPALIPQNMTPPPMYSMWLRVARMSI